MIFEKTLVEKTTQAFEAAGLRAYRIKTVYADFVATGDFYFQGEIEWSRWSGYLQFDNDDWVVTPPPQAAGRRNPEFRFPNIDEAVAFTIFLFQRRLVHESANLTEKDAHLQKLVEEWENLISTNPSDAYREMAADEQRESEAMEWIEGTVGDVSESCLNSPSEL